MYVGEGADVVLYRVTVAGNFCNFGGGVFNIGTLRVTNSTFTRNASTGGGAVLNCGTLAVVNSTFSGNHADESGGAVQVSGGSAKILCSTFTANDAARAGGVFNELGESAVTLANTIAAGNKGGAWPGRGRVADGDELPDRSTAGVTLLPGVGPQRHRGVGPPLARSAATAVRPRPTRSWRTARPWTPGTRGGPGNVRTDQRGRPRVAGPAPDIGAVERD